MNKILLSAEGIFPVTKNGKGEVGNDSPKTGLALSGTIQGEGKLSGIPSLFIRLSGCNLRCIWGDKEGGRTVSMCDTPNSTFYTHGSQWWEEEDILSTIKHNIGNIKHVVITGGEPMLQAERLIPLCRKLKEDFNLHITLETNGTIFNKELAEQVDLFSISPKLSSSDPTPAKLKKLDLSNSGIYNQHAGTRINIPVLQQFIDYCNKEIKMIQFKFVVFRKSDEKEIKLDFLDRLTGWKRDDVMVMPLGADKKELDHFTPIALKIAISNGWRFSNRMHIELFKETIGV